MTIQIPRSLRLLLIGVAALAVAAMALARPADAASPLPDPTKTGSVNITKLVAPDSATGLPNNGTQQDTTGLTPLPGVTFTIKQVNPINLTTNQGWQDANTLTGTFNNASNTTAESSITGAGYTLGTAKTGTTDASGKLSFTGLPLGLYLVEETSAPAGTTPSAPFLVSVPMTDPTSESQWMYDVYVYPKNATTTVTKTVHDDAAIKLGDPVSWTITGDIPNPTGATSHIDGYMVTDQLDPKLTYTGATVELYDPATGTSTTVPAGDYTLSAPSGSNNNTLKVTFTAAGLALLDANTTKQVRVTVNTTANAIGEISNTALLYPNKDAIDASQSCPNCPQPGQPGGPTPSTPIQTKWGAFTIQKTDPAGNALTGAVFSVYPSQADAKAGTNAIALGGQTQFQVGTDGQLTLSGLRYSDFADGHQLNAGDPGWQDYYLVETKAPAGYELLAEPIKFDVTAATTTAGVDMNVKNVPSNSGFKLPLTGGPGAILVYLAGALILLGALMVALGRRTHAK